jgi:ribose 1,5-bisphosphokinase PhnN
MCSPHSHTPNAHATRFGAVTDVYTLFVTASKTTLRRRLSSRGREDDTQVEARLARATAVVPEGHDVITVRVDSHEFNGDERNDKCG